MLPKTPDVCPRCGEGKPKRRERMVAVDGGRKGVRFFHKCGYTSEVLFDDGTSAKSRMKSMQVSEGDK